MIFVMVSTTANAMELCLLGGESASLWAFISISVLISALVLVADFVYVAGPSEEDWYSYWYEYWYYIRFRIGSSSKSTSRRSRICIVAFVGASVVAVGAGLVEVGVGLL